MHNPLTIAGFLVMPPALGGWGCIKCCIPSVCLSVRVPCLQFIRNRRAV